MSNFIERTVQTWGGEARGLESALNEMRQRELSGYRFVAGPLTKVADEQELHALGEALADDEFPGVRAHLTSAIQLLSDRQQPDDRRSIKESISAVESLAQARTNDSKATLGAR